MMVLVLVMMTTMMLMDAQVLTLSHSTHGAACIVLKA
jgi:hypothetical protein